MRIDLTGKTALVTASTKGIGFAAAAQLAAAGATVIVNGRSSDSVTAAVAAIKADGHDVAGVAADVATEAGCAALIAACPAPDILVSNAAFIGWGDIFATDDDTWNAAWQTNVLASVRLAHRFVPGMTERGWGRVVLVSSETARNVQPDLVPYAATKLALHALSRGIAKRVAGSGVTCNVVLPGPTLSDSLKGFLAPMAEAQGVAVKEAGDRFVEAHRPSSLLRRMASVDEVAAMIVYACSPQASATTGSVFRVDGGVVEDVN